MQKADAIFTKAKSELIASGVEFDANKYKTDSKYAVQWDRQLLTGIRNWWKNLEQNLTIVIMNVAIKDLNI